MEEGRVASRPTFLFSLERLVRRLTILSFSRWRLIGPNFILQTKYLPEVSEYFTHLLKYDYTRDMNTSVH